MMWLFIGRRFEALETMETIERSLRNAHESNSMFARVYNQKSNNILSNNEQRTDATEHKKHFRWTTGEREKKRVEWNGKGDKNLTERKRGIFLCCSAFFIKLSCECSVISFSICNF